MIMNNEFQEFLSSELSKNHDAVAIWSVQNLPYETTTRQIHGLINFMDHLTNQVSEDAFRIGVKAQKEPQNKQSN